jgi:hypothetical protein
LNKYNLQENPWLQNLYGLREKWVVVYRDSFTVDITTTQRSEGMNYVFKRRFHRKLGLSELIVECEKVVNYIQDFPLLKTVVESYTRRMYTEFEEEFKCQFSYSCKLLQTEGSISTFMVMHMHSNCGATVAFNIDDKTITCSCRKF